MFSRLLFDFIKTVEKKHFLLSSFVLIYSITSDASQVMWGKKCALALEKTMMTHTSCFQKKITVKDGEFKVNILSSSLIQYLHVWLFESFVYLETNCLVYESAEENENKLYRPSEENTFCSIKREKYAKLVTKQQRNDEIFKQWLNVNMCLEDEMHYYLYCRWVLFFPSTLCMRVWFSRRLPTWRNLITCFHSIQPTNNEI